MQAFDERFIVGARKTSASTVSFSRRRSSGRGRKCGGKAGGPKAIHSDYVRYEWEHALLFAKGLLPILRLGDYRSCRKSATRSRRWTGSLPSWALAHSLAW